MKILKLLNKTFLSILVIFFIFIQNSNSDDQPVDIWNIDKSKINGNNNENINQKAENENLNQISTIDTIILEPQSPIKEIEFDQNLNSKKVEHTIADLPRL